MRDGECVWGAEAGMVCLLDVNSLA